MLFRSERSIRNSLFIGNQSFNGGATEASGDLLRVVNSTLVASQSVAGGGAISFYGGGGLVANCILWGNTATDAAYRRTTEQAQLLFSGGTLTVSNTCLQGLSQFAGNGNVGFDPLFAAGGGDYRLTARSPAIGLGEPALLADATADLAGNPRLRSGGPGTGLDAGAFQFQGAPGSPVAILSGPQPISVCASGHALNFSASLTNDLTEAVWLVDSGGGFEPATDAALFASSLQTGPTNVATLTLHSPSVAMNGDRKSVV